MQTRQATAANNKKLREQAVVRPPRRRRMANLGDVMNRLAQLDNAHKSYYMFDRLNKNLTNNPNENYNLLEEEISNSLEIHMNKKTVKFNRRKHKRDPWITFGILHSINRKNFLYKKLKKTNGESDVYEVRKQQFNQFKNTLRRTINHVKKLYFHTQFEKHEGNGTKT